MPSRAGTWVAVREVLRNRETLKVNRQTMRTRPSCEPWRVALTWPSCRPGMRSLREALLYRCGIPLRSPPTHTPLLGTQLRQLPVPGDAPDVGEVG